MERGQHNVGARPFPSNCPVSRPVPALRILTALAGTPQGGRSTTQSAEWHPLWDSTRHFDFDTLCCPLNCGASIRPGAFSLVRGSFEQPTDNPSSEAGFLSCASTLGDATKGYDEHLCASEPLTTPAWHSRAVPLVGCRSQPGW